MQSRLPLFRCGIRRDSSSSRPGRSARWLGLPGTIATAPSGSSVAADSRRSSRSPLAAMRFVLTVAGEAVLRQDGPDLAVVIHCGDGRSRDRGAGNASGHRAATPHKNNCETGYPLRRSQSLMGRAPSLRLDAASARYCKGGHARNGASGCGSCGGGASRPIPISGRAGNFGRLLWFSNLTDRRPQGETPDDIGYDS